MLSLRSTIVHGLAVAVFAGLTGCPRSQFILGDDLRDAGPEAPRLDAGQNGGIRCGSRGQAACAANEFCDFPVSAACGAADAPGTCTPKPDVCTAIYAPVCGCDDKTYPSACNAAAAGISIAHTKACDDRTDPADAGTPAAASCGGLRGVTCATGQYCKFGLDAQCGAADQTGLCSSIPQICTLEYNPVCGCDGKTYGNACSAGAAGVSVTNQGACPEPDGGSAQNCGGRSSATCPKGQYCSIPESGMCGIADAGGTCAPQPSACTKESKPVCGCDGTTYGNACSAAAAGISVKAQGECSQGCGGLVGKTCAKSQYCDFPESAMCGSADQTGTCTAIPTGCTKELNRVCGCDGTTYNNPCLAHAAGTSVSALGACSTAPPPGQTCGGLLGKTCTTKGQYCDFPESTMCGSGDQTGTCTETPQVCSQIYSPVCGCDGNTYSSRCTAAASGVSVEATGPCL